VQPKLLVELTLSVGTLRLERAAVTHADVAHAVSLDAAVGGRRLPDKRVGQAWTNRNGATHRR
jgi:hypothetical protein